MSLSISGRNCSSLHFVGILGSGMSAIAQYCRWQGLAISGSDRLSGSDEGAALKEKLSGIGCTICAQDGSGITAQTDAIVASTAIEDDNPDIAEAKKNNIPLLHRSDVLAAIVASKTTIAVAGTSGKSTVSALIFHLLKECGKDPSIIGGANLHALINGGYVGNAFCGSSNLLVIEADESDGSLVKYHPRYSLFLNISKDHKPEEETLGLFRQLASQSETTIINADDPGLASLTPSIRFGEATDADFSGSMSWDAQSATVAVAGITHKVAFCGKHMAQNLLASLCVCRQLDIDAKQLAGAAATYAGIQRRFDTYATKAGITVIDDYAHNPEKINAALSAAQSLSPKVIALFQPHGFGPTRFLFDEFVKVFSEIPRAGDVLYLLPIYYAGGAVQKDISSRDIAEKITGKGIVLAPDDRRQAVEEIAKAATKEDVIISMGARDPSLPAFAKSIAEAIDAANG